MTPAAAQRENPCRVAAPRSEPLVAPTRHTCRPSFGRVGPPQRRGRADARRRHDSPASASRCSVSRIPSPNTSWTHQRPWRHPGLGTPSVMDWTATVTRLIRNRPKLQPEPASTPGPARIPPAHRVPLQLGTSNSSTASTHLATGTLVISHADPPRTTCGYRSERCCAAAVDGDDGSGDIAGGVAGEVGDGVGDLGGAGGAA